MFTGPSLPGGVAKHFSYSAAPLAEKDVFQGPQCETETANGTKLYLDIFYIGKPKVKFNLSVWYSKTLITIQNKMEL